MGTAVNRTLIGLLLGMVWLAACGAGTKLPPLPADATVLAFGDSLTFGTGAPPNQSYPAVLQQVIGRPVINAGVPGEVSADGLERLPGLLDQHQPKLLILCHGANDILYGMDQVKAAANVRAMIQLAQGRGIAVMLIAVPNFGFFLSAAPWYRPIAEAAGIPLEEDIVSQIERDRSLKSDQIHPNAEGYRLMAEAVAARLRKAGAI